jgi:dihydrofolate reductase
MGKLIYLMNVSLDGFVATADGGLDWTFVDDELHTWFNEDTRSVDASLYGRRMYETMSAYWPTGETDPASTAVMREYARIWNAMPKVVFSTTLDSVAWNSRLVAGDPAEHLAEIRREFQGDIEVSGPTLASAFIESGSVDEYRMVIHPVILGSGKPYFPPLSRPIGLRLLETRTFASGAQLLRYEAVR